jgi:hypothetical protein
VGQDVGISSRILKARAWDLVADLVAEAVIELVVEGAGVLVARRSCGRARRIGLEAPGRPEVVRWPVGTGHPGPRIESEQTGGPHARPSRSQ